MKKLSLIIGFLLLSSLALADGTPRFWVWDDFSKGLNSHISEYKTSDNQAHESLNVRYNDKYGSVSNRDSLLSYGDTGDATVTGLHRYYKADGTLKLIAATGTLLKYGNDDNGTFLPIKTGLTDGKRFTFVTYKDMAIGSNAYDQPIKWDGGTTTTANTEGARTVNETCAQLGAPFAQLSTGANLTAAKWYQYRVAFYDNSTYDYSTARSNPILTGAAIRDINLTDIPIGPEGTAYRYVYRTTGQDDQAAVEASTTFYMVGNITGNAVRIFHDNIEDSVADNDTAPTWSTVSAGTNATPPKGSLLEINNERLFVSGNTVYPSDIYWSDQFNPDHYLPSDYIAVREDDGDEVTFLKTFLGLLTVGKTNSIQKFYTTGSAVTDWYVSDPFSFVGCPATYSVSVSPKGIVYLGRNGIYLFTGQSSQLISDAVTPEINDISQTNIAEAVGYYYNNEYRLSYTSEESGAAYNNRVLVYDFTRDAYTLDTENVNCFAAFGAGTDFGTLYSGSSTTDGYVFAHKNSANMLNKRYKSDIDNGTFDDTRSYGTEQTPRQEIAWDCTIAGWLTELQTKNASITNISNIETSLPDATIARPDTSGNWTSPVYDIKAQALDKLYWNEELGAYGDITFQIRTGDTSTPDGTWSAWSTAVSSPSGSDVSGSTAARYIQVRPNFSTTNINYSPTLYQADGYLFRLTYSKVGSNYETSVLSVCKSGKKDFGIPGYQKQINRIKVFYSGSSGTLSINYKNDLGDTDKTFDIDLSVDPAFSTTDLYSGDNIEKIYTFYPPMNSATEPSAIGQVWQFTITQNGVIDWNVNKIEVQYNVQEIY